MLVNQLLLAVAVEDSDIAVETSYHSLELEAVSEDNSNDDTFFSALVEKNVLQIDSFVHTHSPFFNIFGCAAHRPDERRDAIRRVYRNTHNTLYHTFL